MWLVGCGFGDWEYHEKLATRFGFSSARSREDRFGDVATGFPDNTAIRLADSLNVFDAGALAPGVDVKEVSYKVLSIDAGMKYHGIFLQTEVYNRWLDDFSADGPLPVNSIHDKGFYVQAAFYPIKKNSNSMALHHRFLETKAPGSATAMNTSVGLITTSRASRNYRINAQVINVDRSPVNSSFGYYVGGQKGVTLTTALSIFF